MLWFQGSIPDAIAAAKHRSAVFVVVITGDDEQSEQLMSSWEDGGVSEAAQSSCVAIRVDAKSDTCVQFSQIYPVVCVPSSFFIGDNGIPLEVIAGSVSSEELVNRIHRVNQMHSEEISKRTQPPGESRATETASAAPQTSAPPPAGGVSLSASASDSSPAAAELPAGNTASDSPAGNSSSEPPSEASASEENLDAKVERLTKKLEERREHRKKAEEEGEIQKEVERRKMGKDMQDYKRKQEEEKTRRLLEERNREKAEEKAARERVKQQIAMDRADRAARYAKSQEEEKAAREALLQQRQAEQEARRESSLRQRSSVARIQFRLPDGSSFTNQFPSQSLLQEARQYAAQEVGSRYGNFSLATMFPRREFSGEDLERTLLELELVPSASIVLLPQSSRPANAVVQSGSAGGLWAVLGTILYPLLAVWRFLSSVLFAAPPPPASRGPAQSTSSAPHSNAAAASSSNAKRESLSKHSLETPPKDFKKDGKICRLRTQEDSEDDNNTWNGNSTQQM